MAPKALLFDFDGVIADTENHHVAAWQRTFGQMGWLVSDEVCALAAEQNDHDFLSRIFEEKEIDGGNVDGWVARKQEIILTMLSDSPRVYPGVFALIARLKGRVKLAIVTTTWRDNVTTVLKASGLGDAFSLIVSKEDSPLRKPDPAPYRLAVKRLGIAPKECVALEDSPGGLASALAAGVHAVAVGQRRPLGPWTGSLPFVSHFRNTEAVLSCLGLTPF